MPTLGEIDEDNVESLALPSLGWLPDLIEMKKGGVYLVAGDPGVGKTTLAVQVLGDLAETSPVIYFTTEQSRSDLKSVAERIIPADGEELSEQVKNNFAIESIPSIRELKLIANHISVEYSDKEAIVIDSIQGGGVSPHPTAYKKLYHFTRVAKRHGIATILTCHVTKGGKIAGPKDLQHHVDCTIHMKQAFKLRPTFVPKNRFGTAQLEPFILMMDERGRLVPSPHTSPSTVTVHTPSFNSKGQPNLAKIQSNVQIPKYRERPKLKTPYLPKERMQQLESTLRKFPYIDVSSLIYEINCFSRKKYFETFDLPIALGIVASFLRQSVPDRAIFSGVVDLDGKILSSEVIEEWLEKLFEGDVDQGEFPNLYIPSEMAGKFESKFHHNNISNKLIPVDDLESLFQELWPHLFENDWEVIDNHS